MSGDLKSDIEVLKERVSNLSDQLKRIVSHVESEQRVTGQVSKRVDQTEKALDIIKHTLENKKQESRWRMETVISVLSLLASLIVVFITIFRQ